ncbi:MAG: efflux RND transporter periplasmic adaptor subunit [Acidobacteria bacterium]|nr:MAG: efflux RND transporter periplasmic adaptor subunit [Acidobacteriota bacterium]PYR05164.1 MAG: efflux RND transporter periplasmic adaptor subunit [Acidobacteriota bacterium]
MAYDDMSRHDTLSSVVQEVDIAGMVFRSRQSVVVLAAALAAACNRAQSTAAPPAFPPVVVTIAPARPAPIEDATEYVATLKSLHSTAIQPQIDGQITQIFVKSGDRVAAGAPLMQIDPRRQQAAVSSQQAERAAREAAVAYARQRAQRARELYAAGAVSKQEQEQSETALRTAEADLASLDAQVRQQEVQLRYFTISAPTEGTIGDIPVRVGSQVTTQTLLTTLDQNETLEVYVSVPIERVRELRVGLPVQVRSSDGSQLLAVTTAYFISPHVDDQTQSVLVKGLVRNPGLALRASQYVRARIIWKTTQGIVIPVTAVLRVSGQFFAFVAEDAGGRLVAKQRAIKVGPIAGDSYPVVEGLKPGDRVVVSGTQKLADGAPIQADR